LIFDICILLFLKIKDRKNMKVSIIITHHRTPELLKLCLESLKKATEDLETEIFVLDSENKDDEAREIIRDDFPGVKLIAFAKNMGYGRLVNAGLKQSGGEYIMILNADMILTADSLKKLVNFMDSHFQVGVVGPQLLNINETIQESCFHFYRPMTIIYRRTFLGQIGRGRRELDFFLMKDFDHKTIREVDWMMGTALMVRREALERVGPLDERFFMYFEDVDWCRRFKQAGWQVVYYPDAKMYHYHGKVSKTHGGLLDAFLNKYTRIHILSGLKYFWKWRKNNLKSQMSKLKITA